MAGLAVAGDRLHAHQVDRLRDHIRAELDRPAELPDRSPGEARLAKMENENMTDRDPLLVARQSTHGEFSHNASISQGIKDILRHATGWKQLEMIEREAMDQIALKFSRIASGKSMSREHWEDCVGYAQLVLEKCK
jgi:hypothetical protein